MVMFFVLTSPTPLVHVNDFFFSLFLGRAEVLLHPNISGTHLCQSSFGFSFLSASFWMTKSYLHLIFKKASVFIIYLVAKGMEYS